MADKEGRKRGKKLGKARERHKQCDVWVKSGRGVGGDTSAIKNTMKKMRL